MDTTIIVVTVKVLSTLVVILESVLSFIRATIGF